MTELTVDQQRALSLELGRRDPRFMRVLSTNPAEGQGEYEARSTTTGKPTVLAFTFDVSPLRVITPLFDEATNAMLAAEVRAAAARPPDAYAAGLAALRAANATPESRFEDEYKARRLAELEREHAATARVAVPRMTAAEEAELARYAPPDPYAAGLAALRAKESR